MCVTLNFSRTGKEEEVAVGPELLFCAESYQSKWRFTYDGDAKRTMKMYVARKQASWWQLCDPLDGHVRKI